MYRMLTILAVSILVISSGCMIVPDTSSDPPSTGVNESSAKTDSRQDPEMNVSGVLLTTPVALEPPASVSPEYGQSGTWKYTAVLLVSEVENRSEAIEEESVLVHYSATPPRGIDQSGSAVLSRKSKITVTGTYNESKNLLTGKDFRSEGSAVEYVRDGATEKMPPIVGKQAQTVRIETYAFINETKIQDTYSSGQAKLEVINDSRARVINGTVRLGDTFRSRSGGIVVEVRSAGTNK